MGNTQAWLDSGIKRCNWCRWFKRHEGDNPYGLCQYPVPYALLTRMGNTSTPTADGRQLHQCATFERAV